MLNVRAVVAVTLVFFLFSVRAVPADDLKAQRALFVAAEKALERGADQEYRRLSQQLLDYPLHPYLEYQALLKRLPEASDEEVRRFLDKNEDTAVGDRLRTRWLNQLAKQQRWASFLNFYEDARNVDLRCRYLQALLETGRQQEALGQVEPIWLYGKSRPSACDPVFSAWAKAGLRTPEMIWKRIALAMDAGQWRLTRYLGRQLPKDDRAWVEQWIRLHQNPRTVDEEKPFAETHPYREAMLAHAIRRLARWDGLEALQRWNTIKGRYPFSAEQVARTEKYIVRNLVRVDNEEAYRFIRGVELEASDLLVHSARIRAALLREDWPQVRGWIDALPAEEGQTERWRYWRARAVEGTGDTASSELLYGSLAQERSYYGFMAADRVGADYFLGHTETPVDPAIEAKIEALGAVRRARELFYLERWTEARREWVYATRDMNPAELKAAAKIAERKGWYDRAIFTLARTGYWDDLELRFPLAHTDLVEQHAARNGIDIAWIYAVMRQESAFMHNARSRAGALGLMQLMPATARSVARKVLNRKPPRRQELLQPEINIAFGSAYLKQMKGELADSEVLATAAYNAGPHRVTRWLPKRTLPADIWIELVPFRETRDYIRRVLAYTVIYEKRIGLEPTRLRDRLHPVAPEIGLMSERTTETIDAG